MVKKSLVTKKVSKGKPIMGAKMRNAAGITKDSKVKTARELGL